MPGAQEPDMCQDPRKIRDPGCGTLTDPGLVFCRGIQWILDLIHTVLVGSCRYRILFRQIAAGSWRSWILLSENSLAQVGLRPLTLARTGGGGGWWFS